MPRLSLFPTRIPAAAVVAASLTLALVPAAPHTWAESEPAVAVAAGQPAYDTHAEWQADLNAAEQEVEDAQDALDSAQEDASAQHSRVDAAQSAVDKAVAQRDTAQAELDALDVAQREAEVKAAESALGEAEQDYNRVDEDREQARQAHAQARADLDKAQAEKDKQHKLVDDSEKAVKDLSTERERYTEAIAEARRREHGAPDFTEEGWARLTAQGVVEMINQYRQAHGMHKLVTHVVYNHQAEGWSRQMVSDYNATHDDEYSFRHSDFDEWGHTGENIIYSFVDDWQSDPSTWDRTSWHPMSYKLFDGWRRSPGHNQGMLSPRVQGVGVGVAVAEDGRVYATTMFFDEGGATPYADASGQPYYVADGALATMGAKRLEDPWNNPGQEPSYAGMTTAGLDKTRGKSPGMDPRISSIDYAAVVQYLEGEAAKLDAVIQNISNALPERREKLAELNDTLSRATKRSQDTQSDLTYAEAQVDDAANTLRAAQGHLSDTKEALKQAKDTPRAPYEKALADAEAALDAAQRDLDAQRSTLATTNQRVVDAQARVDRAEERVSEVRGAEPRTSSPKPSGTGGGSSTAGTVIGIIVAILAALGLAATVAPQLGIDLSQFGL